jgi:hypothetical protein
MQYNPSSHTNLTFLHQPWPRASSSAAVAGLPCPRARPRPTTLPCPDSRQFDFLSKKKIPTFLKNVATFFKMLTKNS